MFQRPANICTWHTQIPKKVRKELPIDIYRIHSEPPIRILTEIYNHPALFKIVSKLQTVNLGIE